MSFRVKCIVLISDFDARTPLGQCATEFLVEEDNAGVGRETVSFVAADTFAKALQQTGMAHLISSAPGVMQTLKAAPEDPRRTIMTKAVGELARKVYSAVTDVVMEEQAKHQARGKK